MRVPSNLLRNRVATISRREETGAGYTDTVIAADLPARIDWKSEQEQRPTGTITRSVAVIYCRPIDGIAAGCRVALANDTILEIRSTATVFAASGTPAMTKIEAW